MGNKQSTSRSAAHHHHHHHHAHSSPPSVELQMAENNNLYNDADLPQQHHQHQHNHQHNSEENGDHQGISEQTESALAEDDLALAGKKKDSLRKSISLGIFESEARWKKKQFVIGALEVHSCPYLDVKAELKPRMKQGSEAQFAKAMDYWEKFHIRQSFVSVAEDVPVETRCFGWIKDDDATMKTLASVLNQSWAEAQNQKLEDVGFELDVYLWSILNVGGKATTNILLIRFFELE